MKWPPDIGVHTRSMLKYIRLMNIRVEVEVKAATLPIISAAPAKTPVPIASNRKISNILIII